MTGLQASQMRAWIGLLATASAVEYACDRQLQRDSSLSFASYTILAAVSDGPGQTRSPSELVGITGHSQSRLSHAIARLEKAGLLDRRRCTSDKRVVHVGLTDAGRDVLAEAAPGHIAEVRRLVFDHLTPEQTEALADITGTLYAAVADGHPVPPLGPR